MTSWYCLQSLCLVIAVARMDKFNCFFVFFFFFSEWEGLRGHHSSEPCRNGWEIWLVSQAQHGEGTHSVVQVRNGWDLWPMSPHPWMTHCDLSWALNTPVLSAGLGLGFGTNHSANRGGVPRTRSPCSKHQASSNEPDKGVSVLIQAFTQQTQVELLLCARS